MRIPTLITAAFAVAALGATTTAVAQVKTVTKTVTKPGMGTQTTVTHTRMRSGFHPIKKCRVAYRHHGRTKVKYCR